MPKRHLTLQVQRKVSCQPLQISCQSTIEQVQDIIASKFSIKLDLVQLHNRFSELGSYSLDIIKKQESMTEMDSPHNLSQEMKSQVDGMPGFPVSVKQFSTVIQDNKTDFMLCNYNDYIFVLVTQLGKMGTLLHARKEEAYAAQTTFTVNVLMGKRDEPMLQACARQLIEQISGMGSSRPLLVSLGLKDHSMGTLKGIIEAICENKIW